MQSVSVGRHVRDGPNFGRSLRSSVGGSGRVGGHPGPSLRLPSGRVGLPIHPERLMPSRNDRLFSCAVNLESGPETLSGSRVAFRQWSVRSASRELGFHIVAPPLSRLAPWIPEGMNHSGPHRVEPPLHWRPASRRRHPGIASNDLLRTRVFDGSEQAPECEFRRSATLRAPDLIQDAALHESPQELALECQLQQKNLRLGPPVS